MPDNVPTQGLWQTDPMLQHLVQQLKAKMADPSAARQPRGGGYQAEAQALTRYVDANRQRLGIPDNYTVDIRTNGQTLYDPNQNQFRDMAIAGGAMAAGGYGLGAALGGGGAAASGGTAGVIPGTGIPTVAGTGVGATAPIATTVAGTSALEKLRSSLTSSQGVGALASLLPALMAANGGGGNSGGGSGELARIQAITEARMRRADPLHQVAVQLAYNRAPVSARSGVSLQNVPLPQ